MDGKDETRITLRLPSSLQRALVEEAKKSARSLNSEIVRRLLDSLVMQPRSPVAHKLEAIEETVTEIYKRMRAWEKKGKP